MATAAPVPVTEIDWILDLGTCRRSGGDLGGSRGDHGASVAVRGMGLSLRTP